MIFNQNGIDFSGLPAQTGQITQADCTWCLQPLFQVTKLRRHIFEQFFRATNTGTGTDVCFRGIERKSFSDLFNQLSAGNVYSWMYHGSDKSVS